MHELLTSKETLEFYARIRGVPENKIDGMVDYLITRLSLTEYKNKPAGTYSGGNKRKLSVAIALIGNPKVVFLVRSFFLTLTHHCSTLVSDF